MDSVEKLTSAITMVEEARGVPLSASCVVHRGEMLELLDEARAALPNDLESAQNLSLPVMPSLKKAALVLSR